MKPGDVIRKTPVEWERATGIKVLDPDGWREADKDYGDLVSLEEFRVLCQTSTVSLRMNGPTWPIIITP